jgi:hypothetical protein
VAADKAKRLKLNVVCMSIGQSQSKGDTSHVAESAVDTSLKDKAEKAGVKASILRAVYNRGLAAFRKSHRPGTNASQWAHARVNSFLKGGPARKSDQDLWDKRH